MENLTAFESEHKKPYIIKCFNTKELKSLQLGSSSKGNQRKWFSNTDNVFIKEQFWYQEKYWKDYLVEIIASAISAQMNLKEVKVLHQEACQIADGEKLTYGVFSPKFGAGKRFISYNHLLKISGRYFETNDSIESKWYSVLSTIKELTGLDYTNYLIIMSLIDYLVGNEDRHLNNFGVMVDNKGVYSIAPLFDFGLGLFEHDRIYEGLPFRECLKEMQCKPFSVDNQNVIDYIQAKYKLKEFFNDSIDLSSCEIPSPKAGSYLRNRCRALGVNLKGVV